MAQPPDDEEQSNGQKITIGSISGSQFVAGDVHGNLELHNVSAASSDASIDMERLAAELAQLRQALRQQAQTGEHDKALGEVAQAEDAAKENNLAAALNHLKKAGQWALDVATQIGVSVASEALKRAMGGG